MAYNKDKFQNIWLYETVIAIHHTKQHAKCLSAFAKVSEISCRDHTLSVSIVNACRVSLLGPRFIFFSVVHVWICEDTRILAYHHR